MEAKPFISVCMIVKDEARHLGRCLASISILADELIIVDTGSTDDTVKIAESFGAKILHQPWEDNFSYHRNHCALHAKGEWILAIDADEELQFFNSDVEDFKKRLKQLPKEHNAIAIRLKDMRNGHIKTETIQPRLYRNKKAHYVRPVHNKLIYEGIAAFSPQVYLFHYGYDMTPEQKIKKKKRIIGMLEKAIIDNPSDWESYFYLASACSMFNEFDKCIDYGEEYIKHEEELGEDFNGAIFVIVAEIYKIKNKEDKELEWITMGLKRYPKDLDLLHMYLVYSLEKGARIAIQQAAIAFMQAYGTYEQDLTERKGRFCNSYSPEKLAFAHYHLTLSKFEDGTELLGDLFKFMPCLSDDFKMGLFKELSINLIEVKKNIDSFFIVPEEKKNGTNC